MMKDQVICGNTKWLVQLRNHGIAFWMQNWLQSITIMETALSINIIHTLSIGSVCNYSGTVALASNMQNSIDKWKN